MALITTVELGQYRDIGKKIDTDKAQEAIDLAQEGDLYDVLGEFLFDVIANAEEAGYTDLMDGSTFTYQGESYTHVGIKKLLGDLAYSRYVYTINQNFTPFGATEKFGQDSRTVDRSTIKDMSLQAKKDADAKFRLIEIYLEANRTTFSRFFTGDNPELGSHTQRWSIV